VYGTHLEDKWTVGFALMRLRKALGPIKAGRWIHVRCWFRKLKPPSKLGHPKFQRQSTETHPKPNHNRGRRFASAHPKTHVFFVVVASTQHHYHCHYKNPTWLFSSLVHFLPTSNLPLFLLSQQLHLLPPRSCLTSRASTMVILSLSLSLSCFDLS